MFLAVLVVGFVGGLRSSAAQAQDSLEADVAAEGAVFHKPNGPLHPYRIYRDTTVRVWQNKSRDSFIDLPATTLDAIHERAEKHVLSPEKEGEYVAFGYEDQSLVLRFTQRFNLYMLGTLVFVIVVGGGLSGWLWWRLSKERRRREALVRSRRHLAEGREKERERLAQEIHDGPVQDLHGLHMQIKALSGSSDDQFEGVEDELMRVTGELRAMSADLHPPALQRFGLAAALRSHADRLRDRHADLTIELNLPEECQSVSDDHALPVFRIAQEAMNNAAQHGQADCIQVRLKCDEKTLELDIQDDGEGFVLPDDWHALAEEDHYGLLGMRERAEAIGARIEIDSARGDGTQVRLRSAMDASTADRADSATPVPA